MFKTIIKNLIRLILTPFLISFSLLLLLLYLTLGTVFWIVIFIRLLFFYAMKVMISIWKNEGNENDVINEISEFTIRHFQLIIEIIKIPTYIWKEPENRPNSNLRSILKDEERLFKTNPIITILILISILAIFILTIVRFLR